MNARQYCSPANIASPARGRALRYARAGLVAFSLALALAGCSSDKWGFPYRPSVQQGNWVTHEQVAQLKQGMTRDQVRFVLGSPTLTDVLHADRWDYVYYYNKAGRLAEHRRLVLLFDGDTLKRIDGDVVPLSPEQAAARAAAAGGNAAQADGKSADAPAEGFDGAEAGEHASDRILARIGQLTRTLRDSMRELGLDKHVERAAEAVPDARDRLRYVASMTEQAAEHHLAGVDARTVELEELLSGGAAPLGHDKERSA